jgi:tryptophan-rich sensory protein
VNTFDWYQALRKPRWAPPASAFGIAWSIIYPIIFATFGWVLVMAVRREIPWVVALPFALNLVFNLVFTPIQFGLKNNWLALADIVLVIVTLVWAVVAIWPHSRWIALAQIPYLAWGCYATALQVSITLLNR